MNRKTEPFIDHFCHEQVSMVRLNLNVNEAAIPESFGVKKLASLYLPSKDREGRGSL